MSIQRYDYDTIHASPLKYRHDMFVLYADHVAAMEMEAESAHDLGVIYGINHERARIRQAVEALPWSWTTDHFRKYVLSIIDGEES